MRLSRGRLLLRGGLLLVGAGFMAWRAWEAHVAGRAAQGAERVLADRIALVEALVALLAAVTGLAAILSLRPRRKRPGLKLS